MSSLTLAKIADGDARTPASGQATLFINSTGNVAVKDNTGTVTAVGAGGGGGGDISAPMTMNRMTASGNAGTIDLDATTSGAYTITVDQALALNVTAYPADGEMTTLDVFLEVNPSNPYDVTWPSDWYWAGGMRPESLSEWAPAYVHLRLKVIGYSGGGYLIYATFNKSQPEYKPRIRNWGNFTFDEGTGVMTFDMASGDYFEVDLTGNVTAIKFSNIPGDFQDPGVWTDWPRMFEVDIVFRQPSDAPFTVAMPYGSWDGTDRYVVPNVVDAKCRVHMMVDASANPGNSYLTVYSAYGVEITEVPHPS